jgi:hypothetical protein
VSVGWAIAIVVGEAERLRASSHVHPGERSNQGLTDHPDMREASAMPEEATRPSRRRRILVWTLIVLAALIALVSTLTVWVKEQLLDTDEWVAVSGELLQDDKVRGALSIALTDALIDKADLAARIEQRLPSQLDPLAQPIAGFIETRAPVAADQLLSTPRVQAVWEEINRRVHTRLVALLKDEEGDRVTVEEGGDVVLDLQPLVERLATRLGVEGALAPDAGQITIMRSEQLAAAQKAVRVVNVLTVFLGLVVLVLLALAVYLARGFRREALRGAGAALLIVGIILLIVRRVVGNAVVEALASDQTEPAAGAAWIIATDLLQNVAVALVVYGILALVGAWLAGPTKLAVRIRAALAPTFREHPAIIFAAVLVLALLGLYFGPAGDTRRLFGILILSGLALLGVEMLRRQTLREFSPTEAPPAVPPAPPPSA